MNQSSVQPFYSRAKSLSQLRERHINDEERADGYEGQKKTDLEKGLKILASHVYVSESSIYEEERKISILEDVEGRAIEALQDGSVIGIGYASPDDKYATVVPDRHWLYLMVDFDNNTAAGPSLLYAGLKFLVLEDLSGEEQQALKELATETDSTDVATQDPESFESINAKAWSDITLRFLKNDFIEVSGPGKKIRISLDRVGLMNRTEGKPNQLCNLLLQLATGPRVLTSRKHEVSKLRNLLKGHFDLPGNPFQLEEQQGYVPNFKVIDDREAADERAKRDARHVPLSDQHKYVGSAEELEEAAKWFRDQGMEEFDDEI